MTEFIYFVQAQNLKLIKIGHAKGSVASRLASLQTGSPDRLVLLGAMAGTRTDEQALHAEFKYAHSHGEWFRPVPDLIALAARHRDFCDGVPRSGKVSLHVYLDRELIDALNNAAELSRRDLTAEVAIALEGHLANLGLWPRSTAKAR